jgi:hypothetical protein
MSAIAAVAIANFLSMGFPLLWIIYDQQNVKRCKVPSRQPLLVSGNLVSQQRNDVPPEKRALTAPYRSRYQLGA